MVTLWRWIVPNIGRQLSLSDAYMASRNSVSAGYGRRAIGRLHYQPLLVIHDDLQALDLVAIHGSHPAQEGGALIEPKLGRIGTGPRAGLD